MAGNQPGSAGNQPATLDPSVMVGNRQAPLIPIGSGDYATAPNFTANNGSGLDVGPIANSGFDAPIAISGFNVSMTNNGMSPDSLTLPSMTDDDNNNIGGASPGGLMSTPTIPNCVSPASLMLSAGQAVDPAPPQHDMWAGYSNNNNGNGSMVDLDGATAAGPSLASKIVFSSMAEVKKYYLEVMGKSEDNWAYDTADVHAEALYRLQRLSCMHNPKQWLAESPAFLNTSEAFYDRLTLHIFMSRSSESKGFKLLKPPTTTFCVTSSPFPPPFVNLFMRCKTDADVALARVALPCLMIRRIAQDTSKEKSGLVSRMAEMSADISAKNATIREQKELVSRLEQEAQQFKKGLLRIAMLSSMALNPSASDPAPAPTAAPKTVNNNNTNLPAVAAKPTARHPPAPTPTTTRNGSEVPILPPIKMSTGSGHHRHPAPAPQPTTAAHGSRQEPDASSLSVKAREAYFTALLTHPRASTIIGSWSTTSTAVTPSTPTTEGRQEHIEDWLDVTHGSVLGKRERED